MLKYIAPLFLLVLSAFAAAQSEEAEVRAKAQEFYRQWDKYSNTKNARGIAKLIAPGAYSYTEEGTMRPYGDAYKEFSDFFKMVKNLKSKVVVDHAYRNGDEIVAWITNNLSFDSKVEKKWEHFKSSDKYAETWKEFPSGWKLVSTQDFPRTARIK